VVARNYRAAGERGLIDSRAPHFPSTSLVDTVEAICRSNRDPLAAASAITGRFWPTPTPDPDRHWQL